MITKCNPLHRGSREPSPVISEAAHYFSVSCHASVRKSPPSSWLQGCNVWRVYQDLGKISLVSYPLDQSPLLSHHGKCFSWASYTLAVPL